MSELPNIDQLKAMSDEEVAALNKKLARKALVHFGLLIVVKGAIYYGMYRWAKSVEKNL